MTSRHLCYPSYLKIPLGDNQRPERNKERCRQKSVMLMTSFTVDSRTIWDLERLFPDQPPHFRNGNNDKLLQLLQSGLGSEPSLFPLLLAKEVAGCSEWKRVT